MVHPYAMPVGDSASATPEKLSTLVSCLTQHDLLPFGLFLCLTSPSIDIHGLGMQSEVSSNKVKMRTAWELVRCNRFSEGIISTVLCSNTESRMAHTFPSHQHKKQLVPSTIIQYTNLLVDAGHSHHAPDI
jgi:hypothetical protein